MSSKSLAKSKESIVVLAAIANNPISPLVETTEIVEQTPATPSDPPTSMPIEDSRPKTPSTDIKETKQEVAFLAPVSPTPTEPSAPLPKTPSPRSTKKKTIKKKEIPENVAKIDPLLTQSPPSPGKSTSQLTLPKLLSVKTKDRFPYRHFESLHPCANRLLAMKWDKKEKEKHLKKLAAVKPKVDNTPPKLYKHLQTKPKKHQMDQERQEEIHRDNRILLERMSNIMYMEAHNPEIHATHRFQVLTNAGPRARAREQTKIALENKKLLVRLQEKQPDHNRGKLLVQHYSHLAHLQNISNFPQKYINERAEAKKGRDEKLPKIIKAGVLAQTV